MKSIVLVILLTLLFALSCQAGSVEEFSVSNSWHVSGPCVNGGFFGPYGSTTPLTTSNGVHLDVYYGLECGNLGVYSNGLSTSGVTALALSFTSPYQVFNFGLNAIDCVVAPEYCLVSVGGLYFTAMSSPIPISLSGSGPFLFEVYAEDEGPYYYSGISDISISTAPTSTPEVSTLALWLLGAGLIFVMRKLFA